VNGVKIPETTTAPALKKGLIHSKKSFPTNRNGSSYMKKKFLFTGKSANQRRHYVSNFETNNGIPPTLFIS